MRSTTTPPFARTTVTHAAKGWECWHCKAPILKSSYYLKLEVHNTLDTFPRRAAFCGPQCLTEFTTGVERRADRRSEDRAGLFETFADQTFTFKLTWESRQWLIQYGYLKLPKSIPKKPQFVCHVCHDSHQVRFTDSERWTFCTACPLPCGDCGALVRTYCANTPCPCQCHKSKAIGSAAPCAPWPLTHAFCSPIELADPRLRYSRSRRTR